ncbi:hypothetical protein P8452_74697 [Trifolium repens]|nr:hypothetical protein P8452_74697 [Trifolium repens]
MTHLLQALSTEGTMSRIYVKNLPKYVTEDRLRDLFSQKGEITEVKLMRTKNGESRQFAYIIFRTDQEAQEAIRHFNKSLLGPLIITCEVVRMLPDANLPRWRIVSNDGNNQATLNKETNATSIANHAILSDTQVVGLPNNSESNKSRELKRDGVMSDIDYFQSRVTTEWSDSESCDDENDNVNSDSESADDDDKDNRSPASEHEENCGNNPSERNPRSGAQELDLEGQEDTFGENVANANDKYSQVTATEEEEKSSNPKVKKEVSESCRLFVRNLPYTTTEEELEEHFGQFGDVLQIHLVVDKETKRSKGIAYIHFSVPDFAAKR